MKIHILEYLYASSTVMDDFMMLVLLSLKTLTCHTADLLFSSEV